MQPSFGGLKTAQGSQVLGTERSWASASPRVTRWWHQAVRQLHARAPTRVPTNQEAPLLLSWERRLASPPLLGEQGHSSFTILVLPCAPARPPREGALGKCHLWRFLPHSVFSLLRKNPARPSTGKHGLFHSVRRFAGDSFTPSLPLTPGLLVCRLPSGFQDQGSRAGASGGAQGGTPVLAESPTMVTGAWPPVPSTARTSKDTYRSSVRGR